jgi:hypothetical protein
MMTCGMKLSAIERDKKRDPRCGRGRLLDRLPVPCFLLQGRDLILHGVELCG